jgi:ubiquinone/menaquinone biosynthesis C-methylase UbiE
MDNIRDHNREAWNRQVEQGNQWTIPVSPETIKAARLGTWEIYLTPVKPIPRDWLPSLKGSNVLCLASGGGQQGPILAAIGANVTVYDNSPRQLDQDRIVAKREGLAIETIEGDMRDLSVFDDASFDLIIHPVSTNFIPEVKSVWREAYRVLRPGGALLAGFSNPVVYLFEQAAYDNGKLKIVHSLPYADTEILTTDEIAQRAENGEPLEFSHTLADLIGEQTEAGFVIAGLYEDHYPANTDLLGKYMSTFLATRSLKLK